MVAPGGKGVYLGLACVTPVAAAAALMSGSLCIKRPRDVVSYEVPKKWVSGLQSSNSKYLFNSLLM